MSIHGEILATINDDQSVKKHAKQVEEDSSVDQFGEICGLISDFAEHTLTSEQHVGPREGSFTLRGRFVDEFSLEPRMHDRNAHEVESATYRIFC